MNSSSVTSVASCSNPDPQLALFPERPPGANVAWLIHFLRGRDWITAPEILRAAGLPVTDQNRKLIAKIRMASLGEICGHQLGYKLTAQMTQGEYSHYRNEKLKTRDSEARSLLETDKVFYQRATI